MIRQEIRSVIMAILVLTIISMALSDWRITAEESANTWKKTADGIPVSRNGGAMIFIPDTGKMLLFGGVLDRFKVPKKDWPKKDVHYIQAFDLPSMKWDAYSEARPKGACYPYYRAVYDSKGKNIYCLSQVNSRVQLPPNPPPEGLLFSFDLKAKTWQAYKRNPYLKHMN
ncbi:hypothetical protein ACFL6F_04035, partial [Planctomycetota bacterium]